MNFVYLANQAYDLFHTGVPIEEICRIQKASRSTVYRRIQKWTEMIDIDAYFKRMEKAK